MVEIRAGTGGDEAKYFAGDLFRMYTNIAKIKAGELLVVDMNEGTSGGFKEVIFEVTGEDVYGTLKFEAGVHRCARVPQTETQGRVHLSSNRYGITRREEFDVQIDMNDVRVDLLFIRTWRTIGKYNEISGSFDTHSNRISGTMQDQNHNTRIKIKLLAYCVPVCTNRN
jgi:protein subunit release factor A